MSGVIIVSHKNYKIYGEKKYPYECFVVSYSVIMADCIMPETQQSYYCFLKFFVELEEYTCIPPRTAINSCNLQQLSSCWSVELEHAFYYVPHLLTDRAPQNDATSLTSNQYIVACVTQEYTLNHVESNHSDGPVGHNNCEILVYIIVFCYIGENLRAVLERGEEIARKPKQLEGSEKQLLQLRTKSKKKGMFRIGSKKVTEEDGKKRLESLREKLEMREKEKREKSMEGITKHKEMIKMMDEEEEEDEYQVAVLDVGMATVKVS